jgi:hypothetical protein
MEENENEFDFLKAFMNVDQLAVQGVAEVIGIVIASLRRGMIKGGMDGFEADALITSCFHVFISHISNLMVEASMDIDDEDDEEEGDE